MTSLHSINNSPFFVSSGDVSTLVVHHPSWVQFPLEYLVSPPHLFFFIFLVITYQCPGCRGTLAQRVNFSGLLHWEILFLMGCLLCKKVSVVDVQLQFCCQTPKMQLTQSASVSGLLQKLSTPSRMGTSTFVTETISTSTVLIALVVGMLIDVCCP